MNRFVSVGDYSYVVDSGSLQQHHDGQIKIGKFTSVAPGAIILSSRSSHNVYNGTTYPFGYLNNHIFKHEPLRSSHVIKGCTTIGNDVYLCSGCIINPGVNVADGCVVSAGAVVTKDTMPYTIVTETNKVIKERFDRKYINIFMEIKWWDWPNDLIQQAVPLLTQEPTDEVMDKLLCIYNTFI